MSPTVSDMARLRLDIYPTPELVVALDRWRGTQEGIPSRAEVIRLLLEQALTERGFYPPAPTPKAPRAKRKRDGQ
jgi:hypothetical protein